jgi:hypothetical protein
MPTDDEQPIGDPEQAEDAEDRYPEKREERRLGCNIRVIWWKASGFRRKARLLNVSKKGAMMRLSVTLVRTRRIAVGDPLLLKVRFGGEVGSREVSATVRWVGPSRRFAAMICGMRIADEDIPTWTAALAALGIRVS